MSRLNVILMRLVAVLLSLVLISTAVVSGRYARYVTTDSGEHSARIAAFVFNVQEDNTKFVDLSKAIQKPGDSATCQVTVSNQRAKAISEVTQDYKITLTIHGNMPLVCKVNNVSVFDLTQMAEGALNCVWSDHGTFTASESSSRQYAVTVEWPSEYSGADYANGSCIAELELNMVCMQAD